MTRFRVKVGRAKDDPEKLVTPAVLYVAKCEDGISGRLIAFGWWDWHVSFLFARALKLEQLTSTLNEVGND